MIKDSIKGHLEVMKEERKEKIVGTFDFFFNDKADCNESYFAHSYTPPEIRNRKIIYNPPKRCKWR